MIAVGPGARDKQGRVVPTSVKAGDRVLLPGWGGNAIKVGEDVRVFFFYFFLLVVVVVVLIRNAFFFLQEYFLFKDSEILAKIEE